MKKIVLLIIICSLLAGCGNAGAAHNPKSADKQLTKKHAFQEWEFIIRNSVDEPLPPEARDIEAMPEKFEAQQIPNANLNDPIVITKMPYSKDEKP
ncbi:hypothetical protein [Lentibacillus sp.]|uniref:hypothetical protein n=1 Tax=Lentibacillus sp. TaxID=1925746 RepID=UPI002B4AD822|nr:hypothetical protein [Lentibacillus sp.]HLS09120.1 hypothetical protein [Lentibacillus sp.]